MLLPPPDFGAAYVDSKTGQASISFYNWIRSLYLEVRPSLKTVAQLGTGTSGARAFVTDANATAFGSIVAGGGVNKVPVYNDGTNWRIG